MDDAEKEALAKKIEDGTYYIAARKWYSDIFHSPIAERSYYIVIVALSVVTLYFATSALIRISPLRPRIPFPVYVDDVWDNIPRIKRLAASPEEDRNIAVMKYMLGDYVTTREAYNLPQYESRYRHIWNYSTPQVFDIYKREIDAVNPLSPYHQYTDLANRVIDIDSIEFERGTEISHAKVIYEASVVSVVTKKTVQHTKWRADITYTYTDFKFSEPGDAQNHDPKFLGLTEGDTKGSGEGKEFVPMTFIVSDYQRKELLE